MVIEFKKDSPQAGTFYSSIVISFFNFFFEGLFFQGEYRTTKILPNLYRTFLDQKIGDIEQ